MEPLFAGERLIRVFLEFFDFYEFQRPEKRFFHKILLPTGLCRHNLTAF